MADMLSDGNVKVSFVPAVANIGAPTVTELTAAGAVDLECRITADGLDVSADEDTIDNSKLCDVENYEEPGRIKHSIELTITRADIEETDTPYETIKRGTKGFLAIRYGIPHDTAYAAAQDIQIYTIRAGAQRYVKPEANSTVRYQQKMFVNGPSELDAVVAA